MSRFVKATGLRKFTGLMFRSRKTKPLLFEFEKPTMISLHSWFVFFPFLAVWEAEDESIIESRYVYPFQSDVKPDRPFTKLYEIPLTNRKEVEV